MREESRGPVLCSGAQQCQIYPEIQLVLPPEMLYQERHQPGLWHETYIHARSATSLLAGLNLDGQDGQKETLRWIL